MGASPAELDLGEPGEQQERCMKLMILVAAVSTLAACAAENVRVRCDGQLQPINATPMAQQPHPTIEGPTAPRKLPMAGRAP